MTHEGYTPQNLRTLLGVSSPWPHAQAVGVLVHAGLGQDCPPHPTPPLDLNPHPFPVNQNEGFWGVDCLRLCWKLSQCQGSLSH